ncbi:MAG: protein kinase [Pirellulaceae bacterium]
MNPNSLPSDKQAKSGLDQACARFKQAWQADQIPSLAEVLGQLTADDQLTLFPTLLTIELEQRVGRGEHLRMSQYQQLFPAHVDAIREVFVRLKNAGNARGKQHASRLLDTTMQETVNNLEASTVNPGPPQSVVNLDQIGTDFGDYELLEELGRGGMGVVYRARQKSLDREVAIKMILAGSLADDQAIERFYTEAKAVGQLRHPNIVRVFEVGLYQGHHFFSMEYIQGQSLDELAHSRSLTAIEAVGYVKTIAEAIHCAHEAGIIHRDLKPSNILTDTTAQPLIMDFGLAKRTEDESGITSTGKIMGTPSYMPPEQIRAGEDGIGPACDVYALGAILYDLLTGRPPFRGDSSMDILMQVLEKDPVPPRVLTPQLDPDLETITLKCLQKDPAQRYESAQALADELGRHLRGMAIEARPVTWMERSWRWCKRKPAAAVLGSVLVSLLLILSIGGPLTAWKQRVLRFDADNKAQQAKNLQRETEQLRQAAIQSQEDAEQQRDKAEKTSAAKGHQLYISDMRLAIRSWTEGDMPTVLGILGRHRPDVKQDTAHRFEWHYLDRLCHTEIQTLNGHRLPVYCIAINPDGSRLASGGRDGIIIWELPTGKPLLKLTDVPLIYSLAFSPDGKQLAAGGSHFKERHTLNIWDWQNQTITRTLPNYDSCGSVCTAKIDYSPDGRLLAYPGQDASIQVVEVSTGEIVAHLKGHSKAAERLSFSPDGNRLVSSSYYAPRNQNVKIWDWAAGHEVLTLGLNAAVTDVAFGPRGKWLAVATVAPTTDKMIRLWKLEKGDKATFSQVLVGLKRRTLSMAFSPDGQFLAAGGFGNQVAIWNMNATDPYRMFVGHQDYVANVLFHPDGKQLISCSGDHSIKIWNSNQRQGTVSLEDKSRGGYVVAFAPQGNRIALRTKAHTIGIWDTRTHRSLATLSGHQGALSALAFSPAGNQLVSGSYDKTVRLWDVETSQELLTLKDHTDDVLDVTFSPDGTLIASASWDGTARVWDSSNGRSIAVFRGHTQQLRALAFSPDGTKIASVGYDTVVRFWDPKTGLELSTLEPTEGYQFASVAFNPDGTQIVAGETSGRLIGWNVATGKEIFNIEAHQDQVRDLSFIPDGQRLASCSWDHTVKLWDTNTWENIATLRDHVSHVNAVSFSPDGQWLASEGALSILRDGRPSSAGSTNNNEKQ